MDKLKNQVFDSHNDKEQPSNSVPHPNNLQEIDFFANDKEGCKLITDRELAELEAMWYENTYHDREFIDFFNKEKMGKGIILNDDQRIHQKTDLTGDDESKYLSSKISSYSQSKDIETKTTNPIFLFEKKLENSDVNGRLNRLLITQSEKLMEFLTPEEKKNILINKSILVSTTIDPKVKPYNLHLSSWVGNKWIVLNKQWSSLVKENELKTGDCVQGWGYRQKMELCLTITIHRASQISPA